nr:uncharacterized protein LOC124493395 [Dermatophagoides farinae]
MMKFLSICCLFSFILGNSFILNYANLIGTSINISNDGRLPSMTDNIHATTDNNDDDDDGGDEKSQSIDPIETTAKLLIRVDELVEKLLAANNNNNNDDSISGEHYYISDDHVEASSSSSSVVIDDDGDSKMAIDHNVNNQQVDESADSKNQYQQEERFSVLLTDLKKIEEMIGIAIVKANLNRQYRLVMRLRPLQTYVQQIYRNLESLRARVVAIATLSNLAITVNDVLVQFGDVMTSSQIMSSGMIPKNPPPKILPGITNFSSSNIVPIAVESTKTTTTNRIISESSSTKIVTTTENPTTLSYVEVDAEHFFQNILSDHKK